MPPFQLTKAGPDDFRSVIDMWYEAFPEPEVQHKFFGPDTPEQRQWLVDLLHTESKKYPGDLWVKVIAKDTGELVGMGQWRFYMDRPWAVEPPLPTPWLDEDKELQDTLAQDESHRAKYYTEPFIAIKNCMVRPDFARRGAGTMIMDWGCSIADRLFLPMWVESSEEGSLIYAKFGFVKADDTYFSTGYYMKREPRVAVVEGGR